MSSRRFPVVVELHAPSASVRRLRLGRMGFAAGMALVAGLIAAVVAAAIALPAALTSSLSRREMVVTLARRTQLGDRLRALTDRFEALDQQARRHLEQVRRVGRLYGLPELRTAPPRRGDPTPAPDSIFAAAVLHGVRLQAAIELSLSASGVLVASLARWEAEHPEEVATLPARSPVRAIEAIPMAWFGRQLHPVTGQEEMHSGLDLAAPLGNPIVAPAAGQVRWVGEAPVAAGGTWWRLGRIVVVAHGERYRTLYGHCDGILVRVGQRVRAGDPIATIGDSGWTPSPRLHYEVRRKASDGSWEAIDPVRLMLDLQLSSDNGADLAEPRAALDLPTPLFPAAFSR